MKFEKEKNILIEKGKIEQEYNRLFKRLISGIDVLCKSLFG